MKLEVGKLCPKCGSENSIPYNLRYDLNPEILKCKDCGYHGIFPTAKIDKINEIQNKIKKIEENFR